MMLKSVTFYPRLKTVARRCFNAGFMAALAIAGGIFMAVAAHGASFTVSIDKDKMSLDDTATLTMKFSGGAPQSSPDIPKIPNLTIDYTSQGSSTTIINGQLDSSVSLMFTVTAAQPGTYVIPSLSVQINGQTFNSDPVTLSVSRSNAPRYAFIKLDVNKQEAYLGEMVPVRVEFYFQYLQGAEMPHFAEDGFTLGKISQSSQTSVVVDGQQYNMIVISTTMIPVKTGNLALGPVTMQATIPRSVAGRNFFGQPVINWKSATLESEAKSLRVLPLPTENVPTGFNGAVGDYTLNVSASPTNIAVGDPLTVKVQISGRGALEALTLPPQPDWKKFKLYPPTSDFQSPDALEQSGTKTFSLTAVPESLDITELPAFKFSYFNPAQKIYRTLTQPAIPLIVRPSAASLPPPILPGNAEANENNQAGEVIAPLKQRLGALSQISPPLIRQPWFVLLQGIPLLAWLTLLISRKHAESLANNPRLLRERQVEKTIRQGLVELQQAANANDAARFFAIVFDLLQEKIGERLDAPASAITEAVLEERLRPAGVTDDELALLRELFQACNQALYAPQSTHEELVSFIQKLKAALAALGKIRA